MGHISYIARALSALALLLAVNADASVSIISGTGTDLQTVNTQKAALTQQGNSTRPTYIASFGAITCNATNVLAIESAAGAGFKLVSWCVTISQATAVAAVNVTVRRETAASSGGTALTAEGTGTTAISKMDPGDGNYGGVARGGAATAGTAGATLDQVGFALSELGAGAADPPGQIFCRNYGVNGEKLPTVAAGTANGIALTMGASGAGGLASCSMSATIIAE